MKFVCNCSNESEFERMVEDIRKEDAGYNFEVGARLWYTPEEYDRAIMVEYQVCTQSCRDLFGESDVTDWLTAYLVDDELDDDVSHEIFSETIEENIRLLGLKDAMPDFAKKCFEILRERGLVEDGEVIENAVDTLIAGAEEKKVPVKKQVACDLGER